MQIHLLSSEVQRKYFKTNIKKFYADKVLKTENDAHFDEQPFNLDGKQMHILFFSINYFFRWS